MPGLPAVELDTQLALVPFLRPRLQANADRTDRPAFQFNLRPILLLALGAVLFTAFSVVKLPGLDLPWAAAMPSAPSSPRDVPATPVRTRVKLPLFDVGPLSLHASNCKHTGFRQRTQACPPTAVPRGRAFSPAAVFRKGDAPARGHHPLRWVPCAGSRHFSDLEAWSAACQD